MSGATIDRLIDLVDGWEIATVGVGEAVTKLRLSAAVPGTPDWYRANVTVWIEAVPANPPVVGDTLTVSGERVEVGDWDFPSAELTVGLVLDQTVLVVDDLLDPVRHPTRALAALADAAKVWPPDEFVPEHFDVGTVGERLESGLLRPDLAVTVETRSGSGEMTIDILTNYGAAIEVQRRPETDGPTTFSVFLLADLPYRVWERTGMGRLLSVGPPVWLDQHVVVRSTFADDTGMAVGALEWDESADGTLTTSDGPRPPLTMASEVWALLPGGDLAESKQEVVSR